MKTRVINMSSEYYPIVEDVAQMAEDENRSLANMADTLLKEAIKNREAKRSQDRQDGSRA